jgi:hypothetical protein
MNVVIALPLALALDYAPSVVYYTYIQSAAPNCDFTYNHNLRSYNF